ncbi:MAG: signal peptide peptidase SppA [Planctomycetota bacterium]|jgi:protease-4
MNLEQDNNLSGPEERQRAAPAQAARPKRRTGWRVFWSVVLVLSVLVNIVLFMGLMGLVVIFGVGQEGVFAEQVIESGPRTTKIAVITVKGIIDGEQAEDVYGQIKRARKDEHVKGLIIRVNSPGGTVSASDKIYNEILKYRQEEAEPVVAFMQGVAASGGYYASVACERIMAEPTAITGSVGVIAGHFVIQELLEEKLGIRPAIIKSGEKKDWPSPFSPFTDEQREYIDEKLVKPAYERFVKLVADGREALTVEDVRRLADGSIYGAEEAMAEKMIDGVGYLDEAIEQVKVLAGLEKAQVVEYRKPFSFGQLLSSKSRNLLQVDRMMLYELMTPQVLYLWAI